MARYRKICSLLLVLYILVFCCAGCFSLPIATNTSQQIVYTGYGANGVVSGSLHILEIGKDKIILDAGLFYGDDGDNAPPLDENVLDGISAIVISHAHLDHIGRLLEVVDLGYSGPIYCTQPTRDLLPVMLRMEARYGDFGPETFYYSNRSKLNNDKQGKHTAAHLYRQCQYGRQISAENRREIFCSREDLEERGFYLCKACADQHVSTVMDLIRTVPLNTKRQISSNLTIEFLNTPHLPGSAMVLIHNKMSQQTVLYTGDVGSGSSRYLPAQTPVQEADYAIVEGTYGTSDYFSTEADRIQFQKFIGDCIRANKRVIIPAFVLDRSQQVLGEISRGMDNGYIPSSTPVKVFSPSTAQINHIYAQIFTDQDYKEFFAADYYEYGPFKPVFEEYDQVHQVDYGEIAVASSGMADSTYSREFVKQWISDPQTVFIFVGYQDPDTLGGKLTGSDLDKLIVDQEEYIVAAEVKKFNCFSGHANYLQIKALLQEIKGLQSVIIVHSDKPVAEELKLTYEADLPYIRFMHPESGERIYLNE
ncbi:MAG TPA: MBL fold metallo-hydrolase [Syntrophomonadaceae bacterium]|jgi:metallo-beta-lactamase family protein|nr:MBL fold metallo-hydrolase [Syntrophomonadaceae bacterium]HPU47903.1 MBL fold metallo-hydrolase [Syntrophomonadaceae bacterium]HQA08550.1 MBL fold metallo-hydrolase [Syntrophomonadaceae bacterium]HQE24276.1 MBL fold metallo-hydrolase [Syntrophomonadaceae bacterium]